MGDNNKFSIVKYFEDIKRQLYSLGYGNKLVDVSIVEELYKKFGTGFSIETFVMEVLDITAENYKAAKRYNRKIMVLKTKDTMSDEDILNLRNYLIKMGYSMKKANYDDLIKLYQDFGQGLTLVTFVTRVLNLNYGNYKKAQYDKNYKLIILKNIGNIEDIKNIMINDGYENYTITSYTEFLNLYNSYGYTFTKTIFATEIINISYGSYRKLKEMGENYKIKILSNDLKEEKINEISTIIENKGYSNKLINYNEFIDLYSLYGDGLTERDFALKVLKITLDSFKSLKYKNRNCFILKENKNNNISYEYIIQKMIDDKLINKAITYEDLKQLHTKYGEDLSEKDFALEVLGISLDSYRLLCRVNNKDKIRILKKEIEKEIQRTELLLIKKGYTNKKISYQEWQDLYLQYGYFLSQKAFSNKVLKISYSAYQNIKRNKTFITVFPCKKQSTEQLEIIKNKLVEQGYEDAKVSKEEIESLYKIYGEGIEKNDFVNKILGINELYKYKRKTILKKTDILDLDQIEEIKQKIFSMGYYQKKVASFTVEYLYNKYSYGLTFNTFIYRVLGITRKQFDDAKSKKEFVRIININVKNTMELITNMHIKEEGYYSKKKIDLLCDYYNISLDDFLSYTVLKTVNNYNDKYYGAYKKILNDHNQLWIGNGRVDMDIVSKHYKEIEAIIYTAINILKESYPSIFNSKNECDDAFQDALLFFLENGSEIQNNFMVYNERNDWERYLYGKIKRHLIIYVNTKYRRQKLQTGLYYSSDSEEQREFVDEKTNTELDALNNLQINDLKNADECIINLGNLILEGYSIQESKELICKKMNIDEITLKRFMEIYIEEHKIINFDMSLLEIGDESEDKKYQKVRVR